ncbi:MAG: nucleotide exchange factor GrpE [Lentisphaeria bacterium]|nr:nucleotide exchange factor GrpE [Lentisphaerota bacterium]MBR2625624.1 nucleotide exchange factor GrpE [Lentisphaeria bacterium]
MAENNEKITPAEENMAAENSADQVNSVLEQGETAAGDAAAAEPVSEVDQLKAQLAEQQAKFLYLQAEYQNFRRRAARDISDARSHAIADTLTPFLSVSDFLGMAQTAAEKTDNLDAIKQGLTMIIAQFDKALEEMSVRKFTSTGEKFDPDLHDAVGREPSDTVPEDVVIREWNCGYKIGEKLLRPARVLVSSGPAAAETAENADKE